MKSNTLHLMLVVVCMSLVMAVPSLSTSVQAATECYKYLTFKNEGAYIANVKVSYHFSSYMFEKSTGNFNRGQEKRVGVPCNATDVMPYVEIIGSVNRMNSRYKFYKAEDRCFLLKGTTGNPLWESCDPPGTSPIYVNNCWKQVTVKHEGAYVARGRLYYTFRGEHAEFSLTTDTGQFYHGQVKRIAVPCASDSHIYVNRFEADDFLDKELAKNLDHCFILKGTQSSPRYELCAVAGEQRRNINLRNYGAYATDLWVTYDYNGERLTNKITIQTQQRGGTSIPMQASNVNVKAKAVAGETIFNMNFTTVQNLCYEVRGTTLSTRWAYCTP